MNQKSSSLLNSAAFLALTATGLTLQTGTALSEQANELTEIVVIEAPIEVSQVGQTNIGGKIELIELKQQVSYDDLDLSKHVDVVELRSRVETISKKSCDKLFAKYVPYSDPAEKRRCIKKAINSVEKQVQAAIVAAS
ncbi:MAG: UrcA family protein [Woeseiaceae bacterium]